ncbi:MAG: tRNA uridine-5-carboxymethylaminomethyl(34) synthesis GTPase MnmE [Lachnospiraceae bacterium]|nr:tRNA uridine-5-carboxymethylaminomethyl(34) synthesis GTPase MnmE [Lachnospiraceae bacterium]
MGMTDQDTIVGIASGMGGSIGIIRVSGSQAFSITSSIFRKKNSVLCDENYLEKQSSHTIHYGFLINEDGSVLDEVMLLLMKAPSTYTREDVVEIDCHGGDFIIQKILKRLLHAGARLAEPGEFTKRAFLNGRIDLSQAEAVMKLISSKNDFALHSAVNQLEGSVSKYIEEIRQKILYDMGYIESALDDPEHYDLDGFSEKLEKTTAEEIKQLQELLSKFEDGRMKSEGINTIIIGKPNAGKSSLMNLLLDEERAIVTNIAGTTRDALEETVRLGDLILKLVDTAGIHETDDPVENIGVQKAVQYMDHADFILFLVDSSVPLSEADEQIIQLIHDKKGVILLNKADLKEMVSEKEIQNKLPWNCISFSNETKEGLTELEDYLKHSFLQGEITYNDQIYLTSVRHRDVVEQACSSLNHVLSAIKDGMPEDFFTIDMMDAYQKLGLINGETASEDLVNKIFQEFCMGK